MADQQGPAHGNEDPFATYRGLAPGWYRDPVNPKMARYWDGTRLGYMQLEIASGEPESPGVNRSDRARGARVPPPGYRSPSDVTICFHWDGRGETQERLANAVPVLPEFLPAMSPMRVASQVDRGKGRWRFSANSGMHLDFPGPVELPPALPRTCGAPRSYRRVLFVALTVAVSVAAASVIATVRASELVEALGWAIATPLLLVLATVIGPRRSAPAHAMRRRSGSGRDAVPRHEVSEVRPDGRQRCGSSPGAPSDPGAALGREVSGRLSQQR